MCIDERLVKLQIWDTAGQERFRSITSSYYRGAQGVLIVYDVCNPTSFEKVKDWFQELKTSTQDNVVLTLVGNKTDLAAVRKVSTQQGQSLAEEFHVKHFETSAKCDENVTTLFATLARDIVQARKAHEAATLKGDGKRRKSTTDDRVTPTDAPKEVGQGGCC
eukprot:TRINITY_DN2021_c0_g1_i2.p1 TRINITY_DN2021_c0_g1~~TRINITY_DN2021_c0_g1_i2.p1  ORF type:complete len:163 (-),score=54.19 TRINITY_DN2021_c0_g1_i2:80-568(-)